MSEPGKASPRRPPFLRKAFRSAATSAAGSLATAVVQLVFAGLAIRYLGTSRAGFFLTLQTLTGLNLVLGDLGLGAAAIRQVAALNAAGRDEESAKTVAAVSAVTGVTAMLLAAVLVIFFDALFAWSRLDAQYYEDAKLATYITMLGFVISQVTGPWRATYAALQRYEIEGVMNTATGVISGIGGIIALSVVPSMTALAIVRTSVYMGRAILDSRIVGPLIGAVPWPRFSWTRIRPLTSFGFWTLVDSVSSTILARANTIILTQFLGSAALPYYELPQRTFALIHGALARQSHFLLPLLATYGDDVVNQVRRTEDRLRWLVSVVGVVIYVGMAITGPLVLAYLVSPEFASHSRWVLYVTCVQGFVHSVDIIPYFASLAIGTARPNALATMLQGLLVSATAFLLIPVYGVFGAALSQLWVIVTVAMHTRWVGQLVPRQPDSAPRLSAYVSPLAMALVWIGCWQLVNMVLDGVLAVAVSLAFGAFAGGLTLLIIERMFFRKRQRLETLARIIVEAKQRLAGLGAASAERRYSN